LPAKVLTITKVLTVPYTKMLSERLSWKPYSMRVLAKMLGERLSWGRRAITWQGYPRPYPA
jgi:hypothetical protein